jgi:hypothetical protein
MLESVMREQRVTATEVRQAVRSAGQQRDGTLETRDARLPRRCTMADRRRLGVQDALWLEMDRPNNLMVVDSVVWTAEPLDWDRVRQVTEERLTTRYPVFRSRAVKDTDGSWWWEVDDGFDFEEHVTVVDLKDPDDPRELQELVASHRTEMLDRSRPLWQALWVNRYLRGAPWSCEPTMPSPTACAWWSSP